MRYLIGISILAIMLTACGRFPNDGLDNVEAVKWLRKSAEQNHDKAQLFLGRMYVAGKGVRENYIEAQSLYRKSAHQGNTDAMIELGDMYMEGTGVLADKSKAFQWYSDAAASGASTGRYKLGQIHANKYSPNYNIKRAYQLFYLAELSGYGMAKADLAVLKPLILPNQIAKTVSYTHLTLPTIYSV